MVLRVSLRPHWGPGRVKNFRCSGPTPAPPFSELTYRCTHDDGAEPLPALVGGGVPTAPHAGGFPLVGVGAGPRPARRAETVWHVGRDDLGAPLYFTTKTTVEDGMWPPANLPPGGPTFPFWAHHPIISKKCIKTYHNGTNSSLFERARPLGVGGGTLGRPPLPPPLGEVPQCAHWGGGGKPRPIQTRRNFIYVIPENGAL